jgi:hypothetical protein
MQQNADMSIKPEYRQEVDMLKVCRTYQVIKPGEWKQGVEIFHEGHVLGFVDRERTLEAETVRTRNIFGEVMEGECIEWLMRRFA